MALERAQVHLEQMIRIKEFEEGARYKKAVFLFPTEWDFWLDEDGSIVIKEIEENAITYKSDLIHVINIDDALDLKYQVTNVLTARRYAEKLPDILWHCVTQGLIFTRLTEDLLDWIKGQTVDWQYGVHEMDQFWLPCSKPLDEVRIGEHICIFNRRVGGWDGSLERPVVELLGAGGHVPSIWNSKQEEFVPLDVISNLKKEFKEELGIDLGDRDINVLGGYKNTFTHELVILAAIELSPKLVPYIYKYTRYNIAANIQGIYMGTFEDVIDYYRMSPVYFAGGVAAVHCNFPNQPELMERILEYVQCGMSNT